MFNKIDDPQNHVGIGTDDRVGRVFGRRVSRLTKAITVLATVAIAIVYLGGSGQTRNEHSQVNKEWFEQQPIASALPVLEEGKQIFRFDTFGDEAFWGDTLKLHQAIEGTKIGGVGAGVSPKTALAVGLKVDLDLLPAELVKKIKQSQVNLDDPAITLALIKLNSVLGVQGQFNHDGSLKTIGITCALCHSTDDNAFAPGIGHRLDGWAYRDLNVGAIISLAPDLSALTSLLGVDEATVKQVLAAWGPGKFDAGLVDIFHNQDD